jgi:hypothetical protein
MIQYLIQREEWREDEEKKGMEERFFEEHIF